MSTPSNVPTIQLLVLERVDRERHMQRYYVLSIAQTLFGDTSLVREWGRIGRNGQSRSETHPDGILAREALETWLRRKQKRGYRAVFAVV